MELENVLLSVLIAAGLFITMGIYYADLNNKYTVNGYYAENLTSIQNSFDNIVSDSEEISTGLDRLSSGNLLDILGGLKQGGVNLIKIFFDSFKSIGKIFVQSIDVFNLGEAGSVWAAISMAGVILMFILSAIIKKITN